MIVIYAMSNSYISSETYVVYC